MKKLLFGNEEIYEFLNNRDDRNQEQKDFDKEYKPSDIFEDISESL